MLFIAAVGSAGMQALAMLPQNRGDDAWTLAVYRFGADGIPSCEPLAGRAGPVSGEAEVNWARLGGLGTATTVDRRCRIDAPLAM